MIYSIVAFEDNPEDVSLLRYALDENGLNYRLLELVDSNSALTFLRSQKDEAHNLFIVDGQMPGIGAAEIIHRIRQSDASKGVPVMVLTGSQDATFTRRMKDCGASECLTKPFSLEGWLETGKAVCAAVRRPPR